MTAEHKPQPLMTIEPEETRPRNSEGAFLVTDDQRFAFAYTRFEGGARDASEASIVIRETEDGGASWSEDRVLVPNEGQLNVMSVSIEPIAPDDVLLFYARKDGWGDCHLAVRRSRDRLRSLSDPVDVIGDPGYYVVNNDRVVQHSSGRLVAPAALHPCEDGTKETWSACGRAMFYLSDDEGRSWRRSRDILEPPDEVGVSGFQEPGVVELRDGRLWMFARNSVGFQWQSMSDDGGETWSTPSPSVLASPCSPASIKRIPATDDLLAVWNDHSGAHPFPEGRRTPLCAAVSTDDGATWRPSRIVEPDPDGWYCYTAIAFLSDAALLGYCAGDRDVGGLNRLKVTRVPLSWIYAGD